VLAVLKRRRPRRDTVTSAGEIMEILEAFDLTESHRDTAELAGCSHHTVARYVCAREAGGLTDRPAAMLQLMDEFRPKLEEWIDRSNGKLRADGAHEKRSVAISSNLHPAAFDELMPKTLATATVDRLLHHAHVCQTTADSVRLSQALTGQGVRPLT